MNIKITYNWLLEYLDTDADPYELQKYLSLCGPSIERVEKVGDDYTLDIEITSNRIDMASVYGIAREASAVLPQFGKRAVLKQLNLPVPQSPAQELPISIVDPEGTARRVLGIVLDNVSMGESPDYIRKRLEQAGIRVLNNIVDVTNYVMLEIGHPTHVFDYDRIPSNKLIFRQSKKGEQIISLEDKTYTLPGSDIIIEDGDGRIIDLPGIIGTSNSIVVKDTKRILFFIDNNDPIKMRRSSMSLGIRTVAATYNEKAPDPELGYTALLRGVQLYQENTGAKVASRIHDIYPHPYQPKTITVHLNHINRAIGTTIDQTTVKSILENLGFTVQTSQDEQDVKFIVTIPSYRADDVAIPEDITEEVARVYGYHNLPNVLPPAVHVHQPGDVELLFTLQQKIKYFLKHLGLHEVMNYSMVSKELLEKLDLKPTDHLRLANTISTDIEYLRSSLIPSLIQNIKENQGKKDPLKLFEIAKTYHKRSADLPTEHFYLGLVTTTDFSDLKGIVETLMNELNISHYEFKTGDHFQLSPHVRAEISIGGIKVGVIGQLAHKYQDLLGITENVLLAEIDFPALLKHYKLIKTYLKTTTFAVVKLDLTVKHKKELPFAKIKELAYHTSQNLSNIELIDTYGDNLTLRFYFSSPTKNLTEEEAISELDKIKNNL